jgi:hypothetical protein
MTLDFEAGTTSVRDVVVLRRGFAVPSSISHFMYKEVVPMDDSRSSSTLAHLRGAS